jgi:hypothetical protein
MHHRQFQVMGPAFPEASPSDAPALAEMRTFWSGGWRDPNSTVEHIDLERSLPQDRAVTSLGNLPLFVVSAASALNAAFIQHAAARQRLQHLWNELQADLSHLSDNHSTVYLEKSGHFVQRDDPDSIVMAIEALLRDTHAGLRYPAQSAELRLNLHRIRGNACEEKTWQIYDQEITGPADDDANVLNRIEVARVSRTAEGTRLSC